MTLEFIEELYDEIRSLTDQYDYNRNGSDWVCRFCNERPRKNGEEIQHRADCFGLKALSKLNSEKERLFDELS